MLIGIFTPVSAYALEVCGATDVFAEANRQSATPAYQLQVIGEREGSIRSVSGLHILPDRTFHDMDETLDTLMVLGPAGVPEPPAPELVDWLRRRSGTARRYGSMRTGAFLLGAAGLLDHRHVTTHQSCRRELAAAFPLAIVEPERSLVRDGPLVTAADGAAGIELALTLVEEDLGPALATSIARQLALPPNKSDLQSLFAQQHHMRPATLRVLDHIRDHPHADLSIAQLRQLAAMSARHFARVFHQDTGMTPAGFVEATRVAAAQRLLEQTALPLKRVAAQCGFRSTDALRRAFLRRLGLAPAHYRNHWGAIRR